MRKLKTRPINPETSTNEKPIKAQRTNILTILGFLDKPKIRAAKIQPTPMLTPKKAKIGILLAKYLKPKRIIFF